MADDSPTYGILKTGLVDVAVNPRAYNLALAGTSRRGTVKAWAITIIVLIAAALAILARGYTVVHHQGGVTPTDVFIPIIAVAVIFYPRLRRYNDRQATRVHVANALLNLGLISPQERATMRKTAVVERGVPDHIVDVEQTLTRDGRSVAIVVRLLGGTAIHYSEVDSAVQTRDVEQYGPPTVREA